MPDCTSMGCPNPGTVSGVYDDGDERARVTYCTECAAVLSGEFTPDAPAAPDRPGDRDQQQAAEIVDSMSPEHAYVDEFVYDGDAEPLRAAIAAALSAARAEERDRSLVVIGRAAERAGEEARAEEAARWQAKIEALVADYDDGSEWGTWRHAGFEVAARLRALLNGEQR